YMGQDDDWGAASLSREILLQPRDLIGADRSQLLPLVLEHVDEGDEMNALVVEALPARASISEAAEVFFAAIEKDVVLARDVDDALGLGPLEDLADHVERARLLAVGDVARVQDEGGRGG